jgi:hypothetical protein
VVQDKKDMGSGKKTFIRKTGANGVGLYKWSPDTSVDKKVNDNVGSEYFCSTPSGSQGEDNAVTYVYDIVVVLGLPVRTAYVQCDYVV